MRTLLREEGLDHVSPPEHVEVEEGKRRQAMKAMEWKRRKRSGVGRERRRTMQCQIQVRIEIFCPKDLWRSDGRRLIG